MSAPDDLRERVAEALLLAGRKALPLEAADAVLAAIEPLMLERAALEPWGWWCPPHLRKGGEVSDDVQQRHTEVQVHHHPQERTIEIQERRIFDKREWSDEDMRIQALEFATKIVGSPLRLNDSTLTDEVVHTIDAAKRIYAYIKEGK